MFPITIDHSVLSSLPAIDADDVRRVSATLTAIVQRRLLPWMSEQAGIDQVALARAGEQTRIVRLEDELGRLRVVSLATVERGRYTVHLHERLFDYLAFGIPDLDDPRLGAGSQEARNLLAMAEVMLRHELDTLVQPGRELADLVRADLGYLQRRGARDAAFGAAIRDALADPANGLEGAAYLDLLRRLDADEAVDQQVTSLVEGYLDAVLDVPASLLRLASTSLGPVTLDRLLDVAFERSRREALAVRERAAAVERVLAVLDEHRRHGADRLREVLDRAVSRWGWQPLLCELGLEDEPAETDQRLRAVSARLASLFREAAAPMTVPEGRTSRERFTRDAERSRQTLEDRVEAARNDPRVPDSVIRAIDRNEANLAGHSKPKYAEFIETLLAVPWDTVRPIEVGPREFAAGLETSHYGLDHPKQLVGDFFANLIWRYRELDGEHPVEWHRTGSAFLFVGPPGVGKTSFAISIATNLGIPFHKVSLGGMRDESDLRGHGFTYEGSKPGAIVQGLIKMGAMNGMFILDEADKTESFAIATLLEILDPEQNHLFHDRYTQTTVDIDLSNCHFVLTANTLETVPEPVVDRCQVVRLDRYAVDEKVAIAQRHILPRIRRQFHIEPEQVRFEPGCESEHLRYVVRGWTHEAGVRQLEQALRTLFLRVHRRFILDAGDDSVVLTRALIKHSLDEPVPVRRLNADDRIGEILGLGVDVERGVGSVIPIQATRIAGASETDLVSTVHATGNIEKVMDESRRVATTGILYCADELGVDPAAVRRPVHLHMMGGSSRKDGPSAGAAIALALASLLTDRQIRRDVAVTGEIDTQGRITGVGGLDVKLETAIDAGCTTVVVPRDNLEGPDGIASFPPPLLRELQVLDFAEWRRGATPFDPERQVLQVVGVGHITEAREVVFVETADLKAVEERFADHARRALRSGRARGGCAMVVLVKDVEELDDGLAAAAPCGECDGCRLVLPPGGGRRFAERCPELAGRAHILEHDLAGGHAAAAIVEAARGGARPLVLAPYYALQEMVSAGALDDLAGAVLAASNYAVQGLKLKGVRGVLQRAWCRLLHLSPEALESAPFVTRREGVWLVDLGAIPEKYRLDADRAEAIYSHCLTWWLEVVEEGLGGPR